MPFTALKLVRRESAFTPYCCLQPWFRRILGVVYVNACVGGPFPSSDLRHRLPERYHSWSQVLFGDAFKSSMCASKLAKSIASQSANFMPTLCSALRSCLSGALWRERKDSTPNTQDRRTLGTWGPARYGVAQSVSGKHGYVPVIPPKLPGPSLARQEASMRSN